MHQNLKFFISQKQILVPLCQYNLMSNKIQSQHESINISFNIISNLSIIFINFSIRSTVGLSEKIQR